MALVNNDIEKYLRGELTPAEMHALEQQALKDPFLAEALEGAEHAGAENFSLDIALLERSIKEKSRKRLPKTITLNGWGLYAGIAAGLTLLAVSTYVIFISIDQQKGRSVAETTISEGVTSTPAPDSTLIALNEPAQPNMTEQNKDSRTASQQSTPQVETTQRTVESPTQAIKNNGGDEGTQRATTGPLAETENSSELAELGEADVAQGADAEPEVKTEAKPTATYGYSGSEVAKSKTDSRKETTAPTNVASELSPIGIDNFVKGKVLSDDGTPLPGVNVVLKGTTHGTVTDENGDFEITVPPADNKLELSFIGYAAQEVTVKRTDAITVRMQPDVSALSEVVVTGYSTSSGTETFDMAQPSVGRVAFNKYLENQLQYPQEALANKVEGKVTVQFMVEPNGTLTDFRVIKGIGFGCDEELLRLIRQGPAWIPSKKNNRAVPEKIKVRLKFELPKK